MNKSFTPSLGVILITVATIAGSLFVVPPAGNDLFAFHLNLALSLAIVTLTAGASILFAMGYGAFTAKLRRAYIVMTVGLTLFGLAYLQLPVLIAINQYHSVFYDAGFVALPFLGSVMIVFTGTRMLAKLFEVKNIALHYWFVIAFILVLAVLVSFLPHAPVTDGTEIKFDITSGLAIWGFSFMGFATYHLLLIKRQASVAYTQGLAWLSIGTGLSTLFSGVFNTLSTFILGSANWEITALIVLAPSAVAGLCYLRSAYLFNQITQTADIQERTVARNFFGQPINPSRRGGQEASSIDIVVYTANLVSNSHAVDPMLDRLRAITAQMQPGAGLTPADEDVLLQVYLGLEDYLLKQEPVRKFSQTSLRQDVAQKLRLTTEASKTFWPKLPQHA